MLHTGHRQSYIQLGLASVYIFPSCKKEGVPEVKAFRWRQKKPLCGSAFFISQPPPRPAAFFPCWAHIDIPQAATARNGEKQEAEKFLLEWHIDPLLYLGQAWSGKGCCGLCEPTPSVCLERKGSPFTGKRGGDLSWFHLWGNISTSQG